MSPKNLGCKRSLKSLQISVRELTPFKGAMDMNKPILGARLYFETEH